MEHKKKISEGFKFKQTTTKQQKNEQTNIKEGGKGHPKQVTDYKAGKQEFCFYTILSWY